MSTLPRIPLSQTPHAAVAPGCGMAHTARAAPKAQAGGPWSSVLEGVGSLPRGVRRDVQAALALARRFNAEVVRPLALRLDAAVQDDPTLLAREFIDEANRWGLYSLWLPKMFGGGGWDNLSMYAFIEEVSTECVGLANAIGVHYLGVATLMSAWNMPLIARIFGEVCEGTRTGRPCLISLAITEPTAGTDAQECALVDHGKFGTVARPQPDGSVSITGRKVFISNGHVSTWHMVVCYEDRTRAADTLVLAAVRTGDPGFAFGTQENKMGQKGCVASELIFDNCRVPPENIALDRHTSARMGRSHRHTAQNVVDYVTSATRAGVGAFATGTARGAYLAARDYAARTMVPGSRAPERLIEQQWAQTLLAEMAKNALMGRHITTECAFANARGGLLRLTFMPLLYWADHHLPAWLMAASTRLALRAPWVARRFQDHFLGNYPSDMREHTSGIGSAAKVACTDLAILNAQLALDLMGPDGLRHNHGVEKRLRDAKLLQIYEGTNESNRVNLFKCLVRPDNHVRVFAREAGTA